MDDSIGSRSLARKVDFHGLEHVTHLAAAGETPFLETQRELFARFVDDKAGGMAGRERIYENVERARDNVAGLLGVKPADIGFPLNVAHGMNIVARSLGNLKGNVVMPQWEYPSAMYPWITGTDLQVRLVPADGYQMDPGRFADSLDSGTRAIVISVVSYFTGERVDLRTYREIADRHGAMLIVDFSHALGAAPFDVSNADFAFGCGYKWALGTHGAGIGYCNRDRHPGWKPTDSGWTSVEWIDAGDRDQTINMVDDGRRFEHGNPSALSVQILGAGAAYLADIGLHRIERYLLSLTGELRRGLQSLGLNLLTPAEDHRRLGIIAFSIQNERVWRQELEKRHVLAWVGDKRVRLSPHVYNSREDVEKAVGAIFEIRELCSRED